MTKARTPTRLKPKRIAPLRSATPFRQAIWKIVDGAVRDALFEHPEYIRAGIKEHVVRRSINKRVVGALSGFVGDQALSAALADEGAIRAK
jgi:hypothetical protein